MNNRDIQDLPILGVDDGKTTKKDILNPQIDLKKFKKKVKEEIGKVSENRNEIESNKSIFTIMSAKDWIEESKIKPIPKMLFGEFWFEGELCFLFADTNLGKSILAVQIGNSISKGEPILGLKLEAQKQLILYFDFELSSKQFENRYSKDFQNHYDFDDNFIRIEINADAVIPENQTFEDCLVYSLERSIIETGAKVLIIDNLTYLKNETEKAKNASPLMKQLKGLKSKYELSMLILAHTPKRDLSKPITRNDLQGSMILMSFADSSFTIGESQRDKNIRYLKQIKVRQSEFFYDAENVAVCQIEKPDNFLQFYLISFSTEKEHLKEITDKDKNQKIADVLELKRQGIANTEIAQRLGVSEGAIRKWIKRANEIKSK